MIIHFDKRITENNPSLYDYVEAKGIWYPIYYVLDSNIRIASNLVDWLNEQKQSAPDEMTTVAMQILSDNGEGNYDHIMTDILRYVHNNFTYTLDSVKWKVKEKWEDVTNVWETKKCDCESGTLVMYILARLCHVPANRLLIMCGTCGPSPNEFGHCWLGYKSQEYPLNWCFMDWCSFYERETPNARRKYYIDDKKITDYIKGATYKELWFAFNENNSFAGISNTSPSSYL